MESLKAVTQLREVKNYLRSVFSHCISSVKPNALISNELNVVSDKLVIRGTPYKLQKNCYVVGFGKAVLDMARETEESLKNHLVKGIVSVPEGIIWKNSPLKKIIAMEGAKNNIPDSKAEHATNKIIELVKPLTENDNLIVLISGGGSSLLPSPIPPITLKEKMELTNALLNKGASIIEVNSVRRKLSQVKGGKLAKLAYPAKVVTFILSDIPGDPLDYIASGPTVPDLSSKYTAIDVLKKYQLFNTVPSSIFEVLTKPEEEEKSDFFKHTSNYIIGNNLIALTAAKNMTSKDGYMSQVMTNTFQGRVDIVSFYMAKLACLVCQALTKTISKENLMTEMESLGYKLCMTKETVADLTTQLLMPTSDKMLLLFGGETSVEVKGSGLGGRNQELALRFSMAVDDLSKTMHILKLFNIVLLCGGTDGMDGPTDAAGAIGYNGLTMLADTQKLSYSQFLTENNTYNFFSKLNTGEDLIKIGHTGTNVMDITLLSIQIKT